MQYIAVCEFKKAFDSFNIEALWRLVEHYGVLLKINEELSPSLGSIALEVIELWSLGSNQG